MSNSKGRWAICVLQALLGIPMQAKCGNYGNRGGRCVCDKGYPCSNDYFPLLAHDQVRDSSSKNTGAAVMHRTPVGSPVSPVLLWVTWKGVVATQVSACSWAVCSGTWHPRARLQQEQEFPYHETLREGLPYCAALKTCWLWLVALCS